MKSITYFVVFFLGLIIISCKKPISPETTEKTQQTTSKEVNPCLYSDVNQTASLLIGKPVTRHVARYLYKGDTLFVYAPTGINPYYIIKDFDCNYVAPILDSLPSTCIYLDVVWINQLPTCGDSLLLQINCLDSVARGIYNNDTVFIFYSACPNSVIAYDENCNLLCSTSGTCNNSNFWNSVSQREVFWRKP